ncbi:hypothetical protein DRI50_04385 [candidate division KSB1 bacterium]|nr:MAG: hypothetical protein DRI50_04385 [candidate division KSB1 bacterium]
MRFIVILLFILNSLLVSNCSKKDNNKAVLNQVDSLARAGYYLRAQLILYNYIKLNNTSQSLDSLIRYYNWLGKKYKQVQIKRLNAHYQKARQTMRRLKYKMVKDVDDEERITAYWYPGVSDYCYANVMIEAKKTPYLWLVFNDFSYDDKVFKRIILEGNGSRLELIVKPDGVKSIFQRSFARGKRKNHFRTVFKSPEDTKLLKLKNMMKAGKLNVVYKYGKGLERKVSLSPRALNSLNNALAFFEAAYWLKVVPERLKQLSEYNTSSNHKWLNQYN